MNQNTAKLLRRSIATKGLDPKSPVGRSLYKKLKREHTKAPAPLKAVAKRKHKAQMGEV